MADSFIQVAPDSTGKKMQTLEATVSGQTVEAEVVVLADATQTPLGTNAGALNVYIGTPNVSINKFTGAPNLANGQVAATTTAATLVSARATRRSVSIRNLDSAISTYIGIATVTSTNGMLLQPKESISVDYTGLIQVVAGSNSANVAYLESYD